MEERRRQTSRRLKTIPATEAELLFQLVEEVAVLTERVNNHLEIHSKDDSTTTKATDLRWLKIGIGVAIASPFVTHVLTTIGK